MDSSMEFATQLATETGRHLLEFFNPKGTSTNLKEDYSVVTEADLSADHLIARSLQREFPDDYLISEELHPSIGDIDAPVWVVDPLDGTTNFSLGLPIWGVSIARIVNGWPSIGVIYFPFLDELYTAQQGSGAFLNGERLHTNPPITRQQTSFFSCCTRTHQKYDVSIRYKTRILGSACYTLCAVARGKAVIGFEATPKIWDIAGGWLIIAESDGTVETFDYSQPFPLQANFDYRETSFPILAGATSEIVSKSRNQIKLR
jgi:myo-inositol-1(or 4)-monophosphatase